MAPSKDATSVLVKTEGMRLARVGRSNAVSHGKSIAKTWRYKNSNALSAWLCVDTETRRSLASIVRNCVTSVPPHGARMLHLTVTAMPTHVKANPVEVSLLCFEATVFVTEYLAHLIQQALGLGKVGDGCRSIKNMYKTTVLSPICELSSGLWRVSVSCHRVASQLIPSDIPGQDIRPSTSR